VKNGVLTHLEPIDLKSRVRRKVNRERLHITYTKRRSSNDKVTEMECSRVTDRWWERGWHYTEEGRGTLS
jgi:hypothetical protein